MLWSEGMSKFPAGSSNKVYISCNVKNTVWCQQTIIMFSVTQVMKGNVFIATRCQKTERKNILKNNFAKEGIDNFMLGK